MFSDDFLSWIFSRNEMQKLTIEEQSIFVHDLDERLEEESENESNT